VDLETARKVLPLARELSGLISDDYAESFDTKAGRAEICIHDRLTGEIIPIAALLPEASYDDRRFIASAPTIMRGLLCLLDEAFAVIRRQSHGDRPQGRQSRKASINEPKDFAAECAMKCGEQSFRRYLIERHDLTDAGDSLRVESRVRSILAVSSRRELNTDPNAAARWKSLRADYDAWRTHS
jgi:hypothetical protein